LIGNGSHCMQTQMNLQWHNTIKCLTFCENCMHTCMNITNHLVYISKYRTCKLCQPLQLRDHCHKYYFTSMVTPHILNDVYFLRNLLFTNGTVFAKTLCMRFWVNWYINMWDCCSEVILLDEFHCHYNTKVKSVIMNVQIKQFRRTLTLINTDLTKYTIWHLHEWQMKQCTR